ncbi:hypothetical protein AVEN_27066-1 [Araneus ventricosus]|uniref:Uncharacterized protein n=1 Tax=Araneus ventricosus TaxID=182803 RepID=A0A4Y2K5T0_ARAVE|nr:hypothetical protein AVEN_27066-1 [Araneus ventricosus]
MKAKLLSQRIPKCQRLMQPSPLQKPFEIPKELLRETEEVSEEMSSPAPSRVNMIAKYIAHTVPNTRRKYILPILEKLKVVNYMFNDMNEFQKDGEAEYPRKGFDLISYLMRNEKAGVHPPIGFNTYLKGILAKLKKPSSSRTPESKPNKVTTAERLRKLSNHESSPETSESQSIKWTKWKD